MLILRCATEILKAFSKVQRSISNKLQLLPDNWSSDNWNFYRASIVHRGNTKTLNLPINEACAGWLLYKGVSIVGWQLYYRTRLLLKTVWGSKSGSITQKISIDHALIFGSARILTCAIKSNFRVGPSLKSQKNSELQNSCAPLHQKRYRTYFGRQQTKSKGAFAATGPIIREGWHYVQRKEISVLFLILILCLYSNFNSRNTL